MAVIVCTGAHSTCDRNYLDIWIPFHLIYDFTWLDQRASLMIRFNPHSGNRSNRAFKKKKINLNYTSSTPLTGIVAALGIIPISYPSPFYLIPTHDDFRLVNSVRLGIFVIKSKSPRNLCHSVGTQSDWYDQASRKSWARLEYEELSRLRVWEDLRLGKILWSLIALDLFFGFPYLWNYAMAPLQMDQSKIRYKSKINSCDHDHSIFYH